LVSEIGGTMKKPTKQTIRRKADAVLQEYVRLKNKNVLCFLCGNKPVQVGHHFVYKSQSNSCRYYLSNIIPLCNDCHCLIHAQPSMNNARVCFKMGEEWFRELEEEKKKRQVFTKEWVSFYYELWSKMLEELK